MDNCAHGVDARNPCRECNDIRRFEDAMLDAKDAVDLKKGLVLVAARTRDSKKIEEATKALEEAETAYVDKKSAFEKSLGGARWSQLY